MGAWVFKVILCLSVSHSDIVIGHMKVLHHLVQSYSKHPNKLETSLNHFSPEFPGECDFHQGHLSRYSPLVVFIFSEREASTPRNYRNRGSTSLLERDVTNSHCSGKEAAIPGSLEFWRSKDGASHVFRTALFLLVVSKLYRT